MIALSNCFRLLDEGFSLITVSENKVPNFSWKNQQKKQLTKQEFEYQYNFTGNDKIRKTENIGIVTGFNDLECIDIDLKVFSTAKEQIDFWNEYTNFLNDNILDFKDKFVIYKTKNSGYHILYKTKRVEGNKKIAKLKGHKEAIIETRGIGGYIFIYEGKNITDKTYKDIDYISDDDRNILISCSKFYNYIEDFEDVKKSNKTDWQGKTVIEDYNDKHSIFDIIGDEFKIVRDLKDKKVIKRHGADSPHSGYVYKDSGCMYLFSTGTIYQNEKLYSPFTAYAQKYHNLDLKEASKELYAKGYGDRQKPKPIIEDEKIQIPKKDLIFPIDIFPDVLQKYILANYTSLNNSIDYMGCSLLYTISIIIGNSICVEVKRGWKETANLWLALVGKAGIGKTPSISAITFPLEKSNNKEIKDYVKNYEKYEKYKSLDPMNQQLTEEIKKPRKTQFIVNDITLEALLDLHAENKNGIGVLKDELAGWFKAMNQYRNGADLEHWLSSWSGKQINLNRKTAKSSFVQKAFIPVLGGIQPSIMDNFYTEENKDNGFIDRMLFCYPDLNIEKYSDKEMSFEYLKWYEEYIINLYEKIKTIINYTEDFEIEPFIASFDYDAKKEWIRIFNDLTDMQNSDHENEYMKSMLPKQKSYIPRFALILNILSSNEDENITIDKITKDSILKAEKLSKYFIAMAKKIKSESIERLDFKQAINKNQDKSNYDKFKAIYVKNKNIKKTVLADLLGVSRTIIYKYIKEYDTEVKHIGSSRG